MQKDAKTNDRTATDQGASVKEGASLPTGPSEDQVQAQKESEAPSLSRPGGFQNDPDDPTNPNEVRERYHRKLRR